MAVSVIVLAAGKSSRMGATKALTPFRGRTFIEAILDTLTGLDVAVVVGHDHERVARTVGDRAVFHPGFAEGVGGSLAAGVRARPGADGYMIAHADMPELRRDVVDGLIAEGRRDRIVAPVYAREPNRLGHPVLFGADFRDELLALTGDVGGRAIIGRHPDAVVRVAFEGELRDYDDVEALADLES